MYCSCGRACLGLGLTKLDRVFTLHGQQQRVCRSEVDVLMGILRNLAWSCCVSVGKRGTSWTAAACTCLPNIVTCHWTEHCQSRQGILSGHASKQQCMALHWGVTGGTTSVGLPLHGGTGSPSSSPRHPAAQQAARQSAVLRDANITPLEPWASRLVAWGLLPISPDVSTASRVWNMSPLQDLPTTCLM